MLYLSQYKVGSPLFRTLAELRHQATALKNRLKYKQPAPKNIQTLEKIIQKNPNIGTYQTLQPAQTHPLTPPNSIYPPLAAAFFDKQTLHFPETFSFITSKGSVLFDGTVLLNNETILADTTTDFHRHLQHHHLLSSKRIPKTTPKNGTLAVIASPGSDNYFHWTLASLPRLLTLQEEQMKPDFYFLR